MQGSYMTKTICLCAKKEILNNSACFWRDWLFHLFQQSFSEGRRTRGLAGSLSEISGGV